MSVPSSKADVFVSTAENALKQHSQLSWNWRTERKTTILTIPRQSDSGFEVGVRCEAFGLYPLAGDWHGMPWDFNAPKTSIQNQCDACMKFILYLLTPDSRLRVITSNGKPFRWLVEYFEENKWKLHEEMGLLFYNYFGKRSEFILQNNHLPPRYA